MGALSMRAWLSRTTALQRELAAIADVNRSWWLLAAGVALAEPYAPKEIYLACDAEPDADTMMMFRAPLLADPVADAIARAIAARTALREIDGTLPGQPLAVTVQRADGAITIPSGLDVAAFAAGAHCLVARLDDPTLPQQLAQLLAGRAPKPWVGAIPFVTVAIGDDATATARHGHRRAWTQSGGPWLGLGRSGEWAVVSTCHLVVDGYGHARVTTRIAELMAAASLNASAAPLANPVPVLDPVAAAVPLVVVWRELHAPTPRLIPLAYRLGLLLHQRLGHPQARFSPTIQIPVARGHKDDPLRLRRRIVSATTSVRFSNGQPEPLAEFETRVRGIFAREAAGTGLVSRLLAAAAAVPVPLAWKRQSIGVHRPPWLEAIADTIGGRALLSRIALDFVAPPLAAVSSPSRQASAHDPHGGCVITVVDDGTHGMLTLCGTGLVGDAAQATAIVDQLLADDSL